MQKKSKMDVWGGLQIAVKRREAKGKGEKERYKHLNAEFQTIAKRDKKAFLSDQCKEIEENNRMGKTSNVFKKVRDTQGTFHAKMGLIKNCHMTQQSRCWAYTLRKPELKETRVPQCSLQHCFQ